MGEAPDGVRPDPRSLVVLGLVVLWGGLLFVAYVSAHSPLWLTGDGPRMAGPADGPGFLSAFQAASYSIVAAGGILVAAVGYGSLVSFAGLGSPGLGRAADVCAELMVGGGLLAVAVFGLGHAGMLTPIPAGLLVAGGWAALVAVHWRRGAKGVAESEPETDIGNGRRRFDPVACLAGLGIAVAFLLALVTALAPPTARDALAYHLAVPKAYIAANGLVELPWNILSYFPFAAEMLFTLGLLVGPDTTPNLLHLGFGVAVIVLVVDVARRATGSVRWACTAAVIVASIPSVIWNAGIAHNEMWMALAMTVVCLTIGRWWETGDHRLLLWCGAGVGIALSAKHTALLLAPVLVLVVLVRARASDLPEQWRTLRAVIAASLLAVALPLPWYLQNAVRTSNPLYPFFWSVFPTRSAVWDATQAELLEVYVRDLYGQRGGVVSWLRLPWDVSIGAQNDVPAFFDGVLGPAFLFLVPVAAIGIFRARVPPWLRVATALAVTFVVIWATQSQQIRFLLPFLPVLAIAFVTVLARIEGSTPSRAARGLAVGIPLAAIVGANLAIVTVDVLSAAPHRPVLGIESRSSFLSRRLAYYPFYEKLNRELGPHERVLLVDMRNDGYYLDVPFVSDSVLEDYTVGRIVNEAASPVAVREAVRNLGITHILVREDILLDPRFTPFDGRPATARWSGFLQAYADRLDSRDGTALYALKN